MPEAPARRELAEFLRSRAKATASELIRDLGCVPLDAGDLSQARNLEAMAAIVVRQLFTGAPPLSAFQWTVGSPSS